SKIDLVVTGLPSRFSAIAVSLIPAIQCLLQCFGRSYFPRSVWFRACVNSICPVSSHLACSRRSTLSEIPVYACARENGLRVDILLFKETLFSFMHMCKTRSAIFFSSNDISFPPRRGNIAHLSFSPSPPPLPFLLAYAVTNLADRILGSTQV